MLLKNRYEISRVDGSLKFLWLELTGKCNLQCQHCYADSSLSGTHGSMRLSDWKRVITDADELDCKSIQFIGGEPTLYPDLPYLVNFAHHLSMQIEVFTNLVAIRPQLWEVFEACQVSIATSFYSVHPAIHESITAGHQSWQRTVEGIKQVVARELPLRVGLIEIRPDQDLDETEHFLQGLGVQRIRRDRQRGVGRGDGGGLINVGKTSVQVALPEYELGTWIASYNVFGETIFVWFRKDENMEQQVHCPICNKSMTLKRQSATYGKNKKEYDKKVYSCAEHDTWTSVEIPKQVLTTV